MRKKIFIGSSRKYLVLADALKRQFYRDKDIKAFTWSDYFRKNGGNKYTYDALLKAVNEFEFAVFFLTRDYSLTDAHSESISTPNIWFEAGLWMSRYGQKNVLLIEEEHESYNNKILFLTDLIGLQPQYWTADSEVVNKILNKGKVPDYNKLSLDLKNRLKKQFGPLKRNIKDLMFDDDDRVIPASINLNTRRQCYKEAERMISSAQDYVYSIISYEDELEDKRFPKGLWPYIEQKIISLKKDPDFDDSKLPTFFKRWMNIGNQKIATQARDILEKYPGNIEIKDTYCNFIEAVITEDKVLLVLPKSQRVQVGKGILIKSRLIAQEFTNWFENYIPEPNDIVIDSPAKLTKYRNFEWHLKNKRNGVLKDRCNSCFIRFEKQDKSWYEALQKAGLK